MSEVAIEGLRKHYRGVAAVDDVSLTIPSGQLVTLLGPSGCGKTTTLNCIAGLEQPDAGLIRAGTVVLTDMARRMVLPPERRQLGMVFQSYALWPHMTVRQNLGFGLRLRKVSTAEMNRRIDETLELVGLGGMADRYPFQLSGGQQQRVALARAVVTEPQVLLLDEPLSNLDAKVREQARAWLRELQQRLGITTVYVTHDQQEALAMSDLIAVMAAGKVVQYAPPEQVYRQPANRFVADFIGASSFMAGELISVAGNLATVRLQTGREVQATIEHRLDGRSAVVLAARAERIRILGQGETGDNLLTGTVRSGLYLGAVYQYLVDTPEGVLRIDSSHQIEFQAGVTAVRVTIPRDAIVVLPDEPVAAGAPVSTPEPDIPGLTPITPGPELSQ